MTSIFKINSDYFFGGLKKIVGYLVTHKIFSIERHLVVLKLKLLQKKAFLFYILKSHSWFTPSDIRPLAKVAEDFTITNTLETG